MVFDRRGYQVAPLLPKQAGCSQDRQIGAFGAAAGEDEFAWFAAEDMRGVLTRFVEEDTCLSTDAMNARRITPDLA